MTTPTEIYGLLAEFENSNDLLVATRKTYEAGYRKIDAYSPFPVSGLAEATGFRYTGLPLLVLLGGLVGGGLGYLLQYWITVVDYPLNVGGRPLHSWPAFIPATFETTVLVAALSAVLGMLGLNGLPRPYHPLFNIPSFAGVTRDRFFLCIEATDQKFASDETLDFLKSLNPVEVHDVPL